MEISHNHKQIFRDFVANFKRQDSLQSVLVSTYTLDTRFALDFQKFCKAKLLVIYGSHKHKHKVSLKTMAKHSNKVMYRLSTPRHGRMHAKIMLVRGRKSIQLLISTSNFADNKRSQNAFWRSPVMPILSSSATKSTTFQSRLISFFQCFESGIQEALNWLHDSPVHTFLKRVDFKRIPSYVHLITSTPAGCSGGVGGLKQIQQVKKPKTDQVTIQPTSFGAHLDEDFWNTLRAAFGIFKKPYRIVTPKLCVYSKIQRKRLQCVPSHVRKHFEPLTWKDDRLNMPGDEFANVPHFKLYYGCRKGKMKWLLMTSMSLSLGACGRKVCPENLYCVYTNNCCKCNKGRHCRPVTVTRNFEMGVMLTNNLDHVQIPFR